MHAPARVPVRTREDTVAADIRGPFLESLSEVPKIFGRISGAIILFVSSKRRRL